MGDCGHFVGAATVIIAGINTIVLTWDSKCHDCGCIIPAGTRVEYRKPAVPLIRRLQHYRLGINTPHGPGMRVDAVARLPQGGTVHHWAAGGQACGGAYTVRVVFPSTSVQHHIAAYEAEAALTVAKRMYFKLDSESGRWTPMRKTVTPPQAFDVYQGNVMVLREVVR